MNSAGLNRKTKILLIGGMIGCAAGLAAAYVVFRKQEQTGQNIRLTSSDGMKLGMSTFSLIKLISDLLVKPR
jgi:gas vesicle protein